MTITSIDTILATHVGENRLVQFLPFLDEDESEVRRLILSKKVHDFVMGSHEAGRKMDYYANVRASLGEYVKGEPIRDDLETFKRLAPASADIWEYRITFDPHARIFGGFAKHDCFVALSAAFRRDCDQGGFAKQMKLVRERWVDLFGTRPRYRCFPLDYCISGVGA